MLGFKSFAVRTVLEFSTGITAVVGPNGAGKSNVADAVRWVLGEQSMRQLRGKKSEDIIFSGGHGKSPFGLAEVSLTIDNSTGWVPSEYSEITVTRRSYRSGENEYLINKQKVRLKDVVLLLAQARIGHDSYTVVGQGLIDAALSLRAEERRGLFEDAAGIRPFQVQRADADNRLRQTEQNLERLRDIVGEIEPRLGPLEEQARRAVEFRQLNSELQEALLTWYALQWRRLRMTRERAEAAEQEQAQQVRQLEQAIASADEQGGTLRARRQSVRARIVEARNACSTSNELVQKIERDLAVSEERITGLQRQRGEQQQEERRLRERLIALQQQIIDQEEQRDLVDEAVDTGAAALAAQEAQVARAQKDYEMEERRLRAAQNDLVQVQARLGASQTDLGRQQKHLGERNRSLAARRDTIGQSQQALRSLETRLVEERFRLETARNEEQQVVQRKQVLGRAIAEAQQEIERLKATLAEAERQRRTVSDRLAMLKNWRQSLSGYSDGVRALLRAPAGKVSGLVGPVPQLGVAPSGLEAALEAALGPYLQAVMVETLADAYTSLLYLQAARSGKAMVMWLKEEGKQAEVDEAQCQAEEETLHSFLSGKPALQERVVGFALRNIQCDSTYLQLFGKMLRGVVIVKDVDAARELLDWITLLKSSSSADLPFDKVVTLAGEVLHGTGWLTAGSGKDANQQGLLAYERELRELPQQLNEHVALIDQLNSRISEVQRSQEGRRAEQATVDKEQQKIGSRVNELNKVLMATQREQERIQTELQLATSVEQQLAAEVVGLEQEVQAAQERVHAHEKSQRELAGLAWELQQEMEELAKAQALALQLTGALRIVEEQASEVDRQISTLEQQTMQLRHTLTGLEGAYRRCLLDSQKARDAVESLLEQLREEMGVADPKDLSSYADRTGAEELEQGEPALSLEHVGILSEEEEAQLRKLRRRVDTLRSRLKALGGCDPDAPQQYEELRTRFDFLSTQIADMDQAALHLRSIIGQLDVTMARQFETTFQAVNARFREHFVTLFNGGNARLEMVTAKNGEEDGATPSNMPAGVEVIVQPPGKKVQDLSLLSGGERALVSAALLFALLEINPPPFCLLDEVDAALDESNLVRFCEILKRLAQRTQFIVITHNRVTMMEAQVIYGVSMGGDSVSRLLSMKLEEAPVAGDR